MDPRDKIQTRKGGVDNFQMSRGLLCYCSIGVRSRWIVPVSLRPMLLKYFNDSVLSGHLGALFQKMAGNSYWPKMRAEIFDLLHPCDLCQRAKPAQITLVGLHSASPVSEPKERLFIHFMGLLTRSKRGTTAILVVLDAFSKFVSFYPVRKISSQIMSSMLELVFSPAYCTPVLIMTDNAKVFRNKQIRDAFSVGNYPHDYSVLYAGFTRGASQSEFEICAVRFFTMNPRPRGMQTCLGLV